MPELPEVETVRRDLKARVLDKKIKEVLILNSKTLKSPAKESLKILTGNSFSDILRRGKLLIFKLKREDKYLLIHLKMTGQLIYLSQKEKLAGGHSLSSHSFEKSVGGELPNKHTRAQITFNDKSNLFFNDLRKFGYIKLVTKKELEKVIAANYGPEPLDNNFVQEDFATQLKKKKRNIKAVLLDQKLVAGLGNIYVDEVLFSAGIRPERLASSLNNQEIKKIHQSIIKILTTAIKYRGTTFSNFVDSEGKKGNFSTRLKVYGRGKLSCYHCSSAIIKTKIAGRGTHYCPNCQK